MAQSELMSGTPAKLAVDIAEEAPLIGGLANGVFIGDLVTAGWC